MRNLLLSRDETAARIARGDVMVIAGKEELLATLPRGTWIGGTTGYLMSEQGGLTGSDALFCTVIESALQARTVVLPAADLATLASGRFAHGLTCILIPAFGQAHQRYALEAATFPDLFAQPVMGWIAGVAVNEIGVRLPLVFDGTTGTAHADAAALLHVEVAATLQPMLDIINPFESGHGPAISFEETGFSATQCRVDGRPVLLSRHLAETGQHLELPLVADYAGARINVSIRAVDPDTGEVTFYAPVVAGQAYHFARPLADYAEAFAPHAGSGLQPEQMMACNCVLNYLYGSLEGKRTSGFVGPITFGEIAYVLLNQTLVVGWTELAAAAAA
ncbi:MAG: hypothetical protein J0H67_10175 [Rhodospirillales bacterium]|nr:hypothetical protein [Rhodospirillales bacterium]